MFSISSLETLSWIFLAESRQCVTYRAVVFSALLRGLIIGPVMRTAILIPPFWQSETD